MRLPDAERERHGKYITALTVVALCEGVFNIKAMNRLGVAVDTSSLKEEIYDSLVSRVIATTVPRELFVDVVVSHAINTATQEILPHILTAKIAGQDITPMMEDLREQAQKHIVEYENAVN